MCSHMETLFVFLGGGGGGVDLGTRLMPCWCVNNVSIPPRIVGEAVKSRFLRLCLQCVSKFEVSLSLFFCQKLVWP